MENRTLNPAVARRLSRALAARRALDCCEERARQERETLAVVADFADALREAASVGGQVGLALAPAVVPLRRATPRVIVITGPVAVGVVVLAGSALVQALAAALAVAETAAAIQTLVSTLLDNALRDRDSCRECIARHIFAARSGSPRRRVVALGKERQLTLNPSP